MLKRSLILVTMFAGMSLNAAGQKSSRDFDKQVNDTISALQNARARARKIKGLKSFENSGLVDDGFKLANVGLVKANKWNDRATSEKRTIRVLKQRLQNIANDPAGENTLSSLQQPLIELQRAANAFTATADPKTATASAESISEDDAD
jgi:hypothetical protein